MKRIPIILLLLLSLTCSASASEYLLDATVNGVRLGLFMAYQQNGEMIIDRSFFGALGLPATEDKPVKTLEKYGNGAEVEIDIGRQLLRIDSKTPFPFQNQVTAEGGGQSIDKIKPETPWFALKSIDFSGSIASYQSAYSQSANTEKNYYIAPNGTFLKGDVEAYYYSDSQPTSYRLAYRDEDREYLRSFEVGYLQHPLPWGDFDQQKRSIAISNVPLQRRGYLLEDYEIDEPVGTRIELWRGQELLKVYTVDALPFRVPLPLYYATNDYTLKVYRADGIVKMINVERDISQDTLRANELNYYATVIEGTNGVFGEVKYGILDIINLSVGLTHKDSEQMPYGGFSLRMPKALITGVGSANGDSFASLYIKPGFSVTHSKINSIPQEVTTFSLATKFLWSPLLTVRLDQTADINTQSEELKLYIPAGSSWFFNPSLQHIEQFSEQIGNYVENISSGQLYYFFLPGHKLGADLSYSDRLERGAWEVTYFYSRGQHQLDLSTGNLNENLYPNSATRYSAMRYTWRPSGQGLALSAAARYMEDNSYTMTANVQGSFVPKARQVLATQTKDTGLLFLSLEDAATNKKMTGKVLIDGIMRNIEGHTLIPLTPYQYHRVNVISDFDYEPEKKTFDLYVSRGDVNVLNLKMDPVVDMDGYIDSKENGKTVLLVDDADQEVATTKTRFGGYYYFRVVQKSGKNYHIKLPLPEVHISNNDDKTYQIGGN